MDYWCWLFETSNFEIFNLGIGMELPIKLQRRKDVEI